MFALYKMLLNFEFLNIFQLINWFFFVSVNLILEVKSSHTQVLAFVLPIHSCPEWMWCQKRQTGILAQTGLESWLCTFLLSVLARTKYPKQHAEIVWLSSYVVDFIVQSFKVDNLLLKEEKLKL